jgi:hypothetical protein
MPSTRTGRADEYGPSTLPTADPSSVWLTDLIEATEVLAVSAEPCDPAIMKAFSNRLEMRADRETVITDLLDGQYSNPVRVVAFNTAEGWSRDVFGGIANELRRRCDMLSSEVPETFRDFVERHRQTAEEPTVSGVDPGPAGFDWQE